MTDYLTEQEQIELLKNWIKQYSLVIIAGVLLAIVSITAWRYWQQRQEKILTYASVVYDEMLTKRAQQNLTTTNAQASKLLKNYEQTTYAHLAALMLARNAILANQFNEAEKQFNWVLKQSNVAAIRQIARLRLARLYLSMKQPEKALETLQKIEESSFDGLRYEINGDAYLALNNVKKAKESYAQAIAHLPNAEALRPLLQMKYDNAT